MNKKDIKKHRNIKDVGLKIGTPAEIFWIDLKKKIENDILMANRQIEVNQHILVLADKKIAAEKEKLK